MFKCDVCGKSTLPKEPMSLFVEEERKTDYVYTVLKKKNKDTSIFLEGTLDEDRIKDFELENWIVDKTFETQGTEIVKESKCCTGCYEKKIKK